jgi:hypothetical protein
MQISIDTHMEDVVVTLRPHAGPKQTPTGAIYVWRLDPDEAERVGKGLIKAANLIGVNVIRLRPEETDA